MGAYTASDNALHVGESGYARLGVETRELFAIKSEPGRGKCFAYSVS